MIDGITSTIEGDALMMEGIISMPEGIILTMEHITMMIEGITSMTEDKCTMNLWIEEGFLHILDQIPRTLTILKLHPPTVGDHRTVHLVHAPTGRCRLGDPSILLAPDIQWSLQCPMKEVGGGTEDTIMIDSIDEGAQKLCVSTMLSLICD